MNHEEVESVFRDMVQTIRKFQYEHGKGPEVIFISHLLFDVLFYNTSEHFAFAGPEKIMYFMGIPAHIYRCDRLEYHLSECGNKIRVSDGSCTSVTIQEEDSAFTKQNQEVQE